MNYVHAPPPPLSCHSWCMLIPATQRGCIHRGTALCIPDQPVMLAKQLMNRYGFPRPFCGDSITWQRLLTPRSSRAGVLDEFSVLIPCESVSQFLWLHILDRR